MPRQLSLLVKGADYPNRKPRSRGQIPRRFEIATCVPGEPLQLVLEPDNPADPNAIMIVTQRGIQIGYVAAERAPFIGKHMREGAAVLAVFQEATQRGAIIRVSLDGSVPELPERRESLNPQPTDYDHYFSDPIWPDD